MQSSAVSGFCAATGWIKPNVTTAVISTIAFGAFAIVFAFTGSVVIAVASLVLTGAALTALYMTRDRRSSGAIN